MLEDDQRRSNQQDEIHLFTAWHPWESYFRQRPTIFRTGVCAVRQGVGFQPSQKQSHLPSIEWSGWEGRSHCRTAPEEGQVEAKRSIPESIRIQEYLSRLISYISPTLDEQTATLYTPHHEQPPLTTRCPSRSWQRKNGEKKQGTQRHYYNQGARKLKLLTEGEEVPTQTKSGNWKIATVVGQCSTPRSYTVRTSDGRKYRRNIRHLLRQDPRLQKKIHGDKVTNQKLQQPLRKVLKRPNQNLTKTPQPIQTIVSMPRPRILAMNHTSPDPVES